MVTELSRYNLGVAFFKTLISRSYLINFLLIGGSVLVARAGGSDELGPGHKRRYWRMKNRGVWPS